MHTLDRHKDQLAIAGITEVPPPNVDWLGEKIELPPTPYALFVPGCSAHRPMKRWPVESFIEVAQWCIAQGITPVLIGAGAEAEICDEIESKAKPAGRDSPEPVSCDFQEKIAGTNRGNQCTT